MNDEMLIRHCAPTLTGLKTASLLNCRFAAEEDMLRSLRSLNARLGGKGLRVIPLRCREGRWLTYLYRPACLAQDLADPLAQALLTQCGYPTAQPMRCLHRLMTKLHTDAAFPHEIGLFLGYPPQDVYGFIHHRQAALYTGCWKVYHNAAAARRTFALYARCTADCLTWYRAGIPL